jgi:hypothetical protein
VQPGRPRGGVRFPADAQRPHRFWGLLILLDSWYRRLFSRGQSSCGLKLTTHIQLMLRLRSVELYPHSPIHLDTRVLFDSISGGGVQLGPLGTSATNRPIVPTPCDYEDGEFGAVIIGKGNRSTRRKPVPVPLFPPQTPHDLIGREPGPPRWKTSDSLVLRHGLKPPGSLIKHRDNIVFTVFTHEMGGSLRKQFVTSYDR